jgi:poly(3-hydroxybutyrate) depolymerase
MKLFVRSVLLVFAVLAGVCAFGAAALLYLNSRTNGTLVSSGEVRRYLIYVPESYDQSTPTPLGMSLQGVDLWPGFQERLTGWNQLDSFSVPFSDSVSATGEMWAFFRDHPLPISISGGDDGRRPAQ